VAAAWIAASALAAPAARADGPDGSWRQAEHPGALARMLGSSWVSIEAAAAVPARAPWLPGSLAAPRLAIAGATLHDGRGWSASLFVSHALADPAAGDGVRLADSTAVNARLARRLSASTTLTLDVFNVLDRAAGTLEAFVASNHWNAGGMPRDFLVHPGEPRGFRLGVRWTFR
jgi:hypothetical protein